MKRLMPLLAVLILAGCAPSPAEKINAAVQGVRDRAADIRAIANTGIAKDEAGMSTRPEFEDIREKAKEIDNLAAGVPAQVEIQEKRIEKAEAGTNERLLYALAIIGAVVLVLCLVGGFYFKQLLPGIVGACAGLALIGVALFYEYIIYGLLAILVLGTLAAILAMRQAGMFAGLLTWTQTRVTTIVKGIEDLRVSKDPADVRAATAVTAAIGEASGDGGAGVRELVDPIKTELKVEGRV